MITVKKAGIDSEKSHSLFMVSLFKLPLKCELSASSKIRLKMITSEIC